MEGRSISEMLAVSYRSMGIDLYINRKYVNSIAYFEYAKRKFENSDDVKMVLEECIIRSKVADMLESNSEGSLKEMIQKEKIVALYFKNAKMFGELERVTYIVAKMIDVCRRGKQEEDTQKELFEFIEMLDEMFESLSLEVGLQAKMQDYWKYGTNNLWGKNYE